MPDWVKMAWIRHFSSLLKVANLISIRRKVPCVLNVNE